MQLSDEELRRLKALLSKGKHSVRKIRLAQVLLKLHEGLHSAAIEQSLDVCLATVYNIHNRYLQAGLAALEDRARSGQPRKVTAELEAVVTRIACSEAPEGKARWTVSLINDEVVMLGYELHDELVRVI